MKNISAKSILDRLRKIADMPDVSGRGGDIHARGYQWKEFHEGNLANSNFPESLVRQITDKREMFRKEFEQFAQNTKTGKTYTDYNNMIFVAIADDSYDASKVQDPAARQTADFINQFNIFLPLDSEMEGKRIGSDWWFSRNGHAYKDLLGDEVFQEDSTRYGEVRKISDPSSIKGNEFGGPLVVSETSSGGFGLFIDVESAGEDLQSKFTQSGGSLPEKIPAIGSQSGQNMEKFFISPEVEISPGTKTRLSGLRPNASSIILPDGPRGSTVQYGRSQRPRGKQNLPPQMLQVIEDVNRNVAEAKADGTLYKLVLKSDGTLAARNLQDYDPSISDEEAAENLSRDIVEQIVEPSRYGSYHAQSTPKGYQPKSGEGAFGPWRLTDKGKQMLQGDPENPFKNPYSFAALRAFRNAYAEATGSDRVKLSGYKVVMIGPNFGNPANIGSGQTTSTERMTDPRSQVNPYEQSQFPAVERMLNWTVLAGEFHEGRQGQYSRTGNALRHIRNGLDLNSAFEVAQNWASGESKGVNNAKSVFTAGKRTIAKSMLALENAMKADPTQRMPQNQVASPTIEKGVDTGANTVTPPQQNTFNQPYKVDPSIGRPAEASSSYIKRLMRNVKY